MNEEAAENLVYSPASLLSIFNALTITKEEKKLVQVRGIYARTGKDAYSGFYYDRLKDEASDSQMTLILPSLIRNQLDDNKTIEFLGFISRRLDKLGRIELQLNIVQLTRQQPNQFTEEDLKRVELLNKKVAAGFRDLDALLQKNIYDNKISRIDIVMGRSAIIDSDIKKSLGEGIAFYDVQFHRINLSSPLEIGNKIMQLDNTGAEVIVLARGGGENLEIFDKPETCEPVVNARAIVVSAVGHAENVTLFEKMADKKFITPTALGNYLVNLYNDYTASLQQSKARIVKDVTDQLKANYEKQLQVAAEKYKSLEELLAKNHTAYMQQQEELLKLQKAEKDNLTRQLSLDKRAVEDQVKLNLIKIDNLSKELAAKERQNSEALRQQQILQNTINQLNRRGAQRPQETAGLGRTLLVIIIILILVAMLLFRK